jgi:arsenate reductase
MEEAGVDVSDKFTKPLTPEVLASADLVITMGCSVGQIEIPSTASHLDRRVSDPAGAELDEVRRVRDDIDRRVNELAAALQNLATNPSSVHLEKRPHQTRTPTERVTREAP